MSTEKYSPGPWEVNEDSAEISSADSKTVVQFSERFTKRERANARLIAAAPELLDRLKLAAQYLDRGDYPENCVQRALWESIQDTIKKAER